MKKQLRTLALYQSPVTIRTDSDEQTIKGVSLIQAVEALGHDVMIDDVTLGQIVALGHGRKGIKCRFTHPGLSSDGLGKFLGRIRDLRHEGDKVYGTLHLSPLAFKSPTDGNLGEYILERAESDPESFGMSMVLDVDRLVWVLADGREVEDDGERPVDALYPCPSMRVLNIVACDVVDEPAANRDGMFSSALWRSNKDAERLFGLIDEELARSGADPDRAYQFALEYFNARGVKIGEFEMDEKEKDVVIVDSIDGGADAVEDADTDSGAVGLDAFAATFAESMKALGARLDETDQKLAKLAEGRAIRGAGPDVISEREMTTGMDVMENAVNWMFGAPGAELPAPSLRRTDEIYRQLTGDIDWTGTFKRQHALAAATPSTLPGLAINAMNRVMVNLYDNLGVYRWFEQIVTVQPNNGTLHDMDWIQFGGIANLSVVADGAAYTEATVADTKERDSYIKHGNYVGITRKMLKNSAIAMIQAVPRSLAVAAVRTRSSNIAGIFTSNSGAGPTLDQDSTALFHADHGNLATTAYTVAAWKAARLECFKQTELGSSARQGLWPRYWLGPADLYDTALVDFGYGSGPGGYPGTANNDVNPYAESRPGDSRPIPLAVPEFTDANDWAYLADPMLAPIVQMSYSQAPGGNTHPLPELFSATGEDSGLMFTNDTLAIKVRDEYAYGVATYRGIGKRNVT